MAIGDLTLTVNGQITNGTAPFTYAWSVKTSQKNAPLTIDTKTVVLPVIGSNPALDSVSINTPSADQIAIGTVCCKVTDSVGKVAYGYYEVQINSLPV